VPDGGQSNDGGNGRQYPAASSFGNGYNGGGSNGRYPDYADADEGQNGYDQNGGTRGGNGRQGGEVPWSSVTRVTPGWGDDEAQSESEGRVRR